MIHPLLHKQVVALDRSLHRTLKISQPSMDWSIAAQLNSLFIVATEFGDACRDYPILFVSAGKDEQGKEQVAPIAVFGLSQNENLFLEQGQWRAMYVPALLRAYPFGTGRIDGNAAQTVLSIDIAWVGLSHTEGVALFQEDGTPSEHLQAINKQLEQLETEVQRTRMLSRLLVEHDLLQPMRFDADLPDGQKLQVEGFLTINEKKLGALADTDVLAMQRNGVMGLIYAHFVSLGNMRKLVQWRLARATAATPATPATN